MKAFALALLAGCASTASYTEPVSSEPPRFAATGDLLPGSDCSTELLPWWRYEVAGHRVRLSSGGISLALPANWKARIDRPDLVVVSAPASVNGVLPSFEIFVSPICKKYETPRVHARAAARGFFEIMSPDETVDQVTRGRWSAGLGGAVGRSIILVDVTLRTARGDRVVALYATDVADSNGFGIHASAICPKEHVGQLPGACEESYFAMLKSFSSL
jgi:hypothetical protein